MFPFIKGGKKLPGIKGGGIGTCFKGPMIPRLKGGSNITSFKGGVEHYLV